MASRKAEARYFMVRSESSWAFLRIFVLGRLLLDDPVAVLLDALQWRCLRRKELVHQGLFLIPVVFVSGRGKVGFRFESVIKTPFIDTGSVADVIDAD